MEQLSLLPQFDLHQMTTFVKVVQAASFKAFINFVMEKVTPQAPWVET